MKGQWEGGKGGDYRKCGKPMSEMDLREELWRTKDLARKEEITKLLVEMAQPKVKNET